VAYRHPVWPSRRCWLAAVIGVGFYLCCLSIVIYIAAHFVFKFW